jgi:hypothetical protein
MKVGTNGFALALLTLISTCGLSGCSQNEPAATTKTETRNKEAHKGDEHAKHPEAKKASHTGKGHGRHDGHKQHGQKKGEHKDHKDGKHHDEQTRAPGSVKVGHVWGATALHWRGSNHG